MIPQSVQTLKVFSMPLKKLLFQINSIIQHFRQPHISKQPHHAMQSHLMRQLHLARIPHLMRQYCIVWQPQNVKRPQPLSKPHFVSCLVLWGSLCACKKQKKNFAILLFNSVCIFINISLCGGVGGSLKSMEQFKKTKVPSLSWVGKYYCGV